MAVSGVMLPSEDFNPGVLSPDIYEAPYALDLLLSHSLCLRLMGGVSHRCAFTVYAISIFMEQEHSWRSLLQSSSVIQIVVGAEHRHRCSDDIPSHSNSHRPSGSSHQKDWVDIRLLGRKRVSLANEDLHSHVPD